MRLSSRCNVDDGIKFAAVSGMKILRFRWKMLGVPCRVFRAISNQWGGQINYRTGTRTLSAFMQIRARNRDVGVSGGHKGAVLFILERSYADAIAKAYRPPGPGRGTLLYREEQRCKRSWMVKCQQHWVRALMRSRLCCPCCYLGIRMETIILDGASDHVFAVLQSAARIAGPNERIC